MINFYLGEIANDGTGDPLRNAFDGVNYNFAYTQIELNFRAPLLNPTFTGTVSGITKAMVGLSLVDNTADMNKPISNATSTALGGKANLASPTFTGLVSGINKDMVGLSLVDNTADINKSVESANTSVRWAGQLYGGTSVITTPQFILTFDSSNNTWKPSTLSGVKTNIGLGNVDNTSDASKPVSSAASTALNLKANLASPTFTGTVSGITKDMVGLSLVDNTADASKPVSSATSTALNLKANLASPTFTGTVSGITKAMVGLSNVDNTADTSKSVNYATSAGSAPANGGTSNSVTINYNNNSNSTNQILWGSGNSIFGTVGIYCNPSTSTFYTNGDVIAYASSDKRLKDNIRPITNALDKISKIGGYYFDWNNKQEVHTGQDVGVIAQEIESILPELVIERDNGYKAVKYEKLVALLIEGIKEQQEQINELKLKINK
jgi:hypothetical protein